MGVDHGLGGRDGAKSKQRREKRAKKNKAVAMKALTGGKKKEVIFDENARTEWLSGFHKRKQERRKYGLAMEVLKKQKAHKEMLKEQREVFKEQNQQRLAKKPEINDESDEEEEQAEDEDEGEDEESVDEDTIAARAAEKYTASVTAGKNQEVSVFEDPSTVSMFGSTVSVVVDASLGEENSDEEQDQQRYQRKMSDKKKPAKNAKPELTRLEKALKIAKSQMGKRKKKHRDNTVQGKATSAALRKKVESSKLMSKVLQKPSKGWQKGKKGR